MMGKPINTKTDHSLFYFSKIHYEIQTECNECAFLYENGNFMDFMQD